MKKILGILLFCAASLFAQEKKYQSLLWEVSGNGLAKKSYLYGSMHVSDKVSYHLSDAFFTHLLNADIVANESEPSTWMNLFGLFDNDYSQYRPFYAKFYQQPLTKRELYPLFQSNNFTLNNLLFRTNEYQKEYQEDTYLDMFIYRTGRKFNKKTVGLEDTKTSIIGIMNADLSNNRPNEKNIAAIQKILKNNGYEEALMNFYRDKDLDMIDSLTTLSTSENYLKALLYDRNIVMVRSIDSLARQGSLFAAVGAAHLPGRKGIIEMLRRKGYSVTPVFDSYTDKGRAKKQQIEELFIKPAYKLCSTPDGIIELPLYPSVIENGDNLESPDLANGGYINVKRLLLRDYFQNDNKPFDHKSLDSLFYENIPGKILSKDFSIKDGYSIYDIKNITKTGNTQHYKYFITPLEIIALSMAGEGDYVRRFEDDIFNNVSLKAVSPHWKVISPNRGGFSVELPEYTVVYGDRIKAAYVPDIEMHSYDSKEGSDFFVIERTLQNNDDLENSLFELKRIHYEFYNQFNIDSTQTTVGTNPLQFISSSKIGDKTIRLKSLLKGSKYYLLGSVGASEANTQRFFNSFAFTPFSGNEAYRTFTDSTAHFSIEIPKAPNERLDFENKKRDNYYTDEEKVNHFSEKYNDYLFTLPSGQTVSLSFYQRHRYEAEKPLDTLWRNFRHMVTGYDPEQVNDRMPAAIESLKRNRFKKSYNPGRDNTPLSTWDTKMGSEKNNIKITNERISHNKATGFHQIDLIATDERSEQAIKYRGLYKNGRSYVIKTIVENDYKSNDPEVEIIFNSFTATNNEDNATLPNDKLKLFLEDAKSQHDSIRYSALASVHELRITAENVHLLTEFIEVSTFTLAETNALVSLIKKAGYSESPEVIPFLDRLYKKEKSGTVIQFAVLNALAAQKSKSSYKKILELLEHDLPLADGAYEINNLFTSFEEDVKHSEVLFSGILQFYSIPEYHQPIINFTASLINSKSISPRKLKSYRKMILTNAKLELKRIKSRKMSNDRYADEGMYQSNSDEAENLPGYLNLLYHFRSDKNVRELFRDSKALGIHEIDIELAMLDIKSGNINEAETEKLLENPETLFPVYKLLTEERKTDLLKNLPNVKIALSALMVLSQLNPARDSVAYVEQRIVEHNNRKVSFYFYKILPLKTDSYRPEVNRLSGIAFIMENNRIDPMAFKYLEQVRITDEDKLQNHIRDMIDETLNEDKKRASFGKNNLLEEEMYFNAFGDY